MFVFLLTAICLILTGKATTSRNGYVDNKDSWGPPSSQDYSTQHVPTTQRGVNFIATDGPSRRRWSSSRTTNEVFIDGQDAEPHTSYSSITAHGQTNFRDHKIPYSPEAMRGVDFLSTDGSSGERWSSPSLPQNIFIDEGNTKPHTALRSNTGQGQPFSQDYSIPYTREVQQKVDFISTNSTSGRRRLSPHKTENFIIDEGNAEPHIAHSSIIAQGHPFFKGYPAPSDPEAQREDDFITVGGPSTRRKRWSSSRTKKNVFIDGHDAEPHIAHRSIPAQSQPQDYPIPHGPEDQREDNFIATDGPSRKKWSSSRTMGKGLIDGWDIEPQTALRSITGQGQPFSQNYQMLNGPEFQGEVNFKRTDGSSGWGWNSPISTENVITDGGNEVSHTNHINTIPAQDAPPFSDDPNCPECNEGQLVEDCPGCNEGQLVEDCPGCQEAQQEVHFIVPQGPGVRREADVTVNSQSPLTNNIIIETIQSSSDSMLSQLNRRCDALEYKLDQQYLMINQSEIFQLEGHTDCKSKSENMLQDIIVIVQELRGSLNTCHQDFMNQNNVLVKNVGSVTQNVLSLHNELVSSISQLSQHIIPRFDQLEKRMMHQEKNINQLMKNSRQGISTNNHGDVQSFEDRVNSFMTTTYQTSQQAAATVNSMSKDLIMLRERLMSGGIQTNPTGSVGNMEKLMAELKNLVLNLNGQEHDQSVHIERTIKEMSQSIALLINNLLGQSGGSVGKKNPAMSVEIMKQFSKTNEYIHGAVGDIRTSMTELQSSVADIRRVLGNGKKLCDDESLTQGSLVSTITGVIQRNNQNLKQLVKSLGTDLNKCCVNPNGHPTNNKDITMIQNQIGGISGDVTELLAELKRLYNVMNGGEKKEEAAVIMRQSEWAAMMKSFQAEQKHISVQLEMYKKALDARQCPVVGQIQRWTGPSLNNKDYKVTQTPLRGKRSV